MSFGIPTRNGLSLGLGAVPTLATNFGLPIPSLSLDYTIPSDGTPGVVPGFYQVDNGFGVLTQTTFSSLITFSRASNATRFSPTGQLQYAPHNLLLQSQDFTTSWTTSAGGSVSANTEVAPDGTSTADSFTESGATSSRNVIQSVSTVIGATYTFSVFAKENGRDVQLCFGASDVSGDPYANFDLTTGTVGTTGGTITASISSAGNGWYRCVVTVTAAVSSSFGCIVALTNSTSATRLPSYAGDGTSGVYIWGAQLALGPYPLDYTPTTTAVVYGPRFDYDPTTLEAKGLLIEEQRTNSVLYSEQFDNAAWAKQNSSVTANTLVAPDGSVTADSLIQNTSNSSHGLTGSLTVVSGTSYVNSVYAKAGSSTVLQLTFGNSSNTFTGLGYANFNLSTGVVSASGGTLVGSGIESVGNGWYRCWIVATATASAATNNWIAIADSTTYTRLATYTGDGTSGIYIWGAQLEAGAFPTSYIPTTTAATTRSADIASIGTLSPWYNATEGTLYGEVTSTGYVLSTSFPVVASIDDGSNSNRITAYQGSTSIGATVNVRSSSVSTTIADSGVDFSASITKLAGAFSSTTVSVSVNGGSAIVGTTNGMPAGLTTMRLGVTTIYLSALNGHLRRITYTPRRLTNAELQSLTS